MEKTTANFKNCSIISAVIFRGDVKGGIRVIVNTHRLVGEYLYNQLTPKEKLLIHKTSFIYGNMKPDLHPKYLRMSHYYRDNEQTIFKMLDELLANSMSSKKFPEMLGIITHFFCDYACIYHANDYLHKHHSTLQHIIYEINLHRYARKKINHLNQVRIIPFQNIEEIREYVLHLTSQLNHPSLLGDVVQDFDEMIILSSSLVAYVMKHYEFNEILTR